MDAAPNLGRETLVGRGTLLARKPLEAALRTALGLHRSAWRTRMAGWQTRALLVALVLVLGLLHGTRTALGRVPPASPPATPDVAAPPTSEPDARRGHFFRPAGSTASRPRLVLRPVVWRPAPPAPAPRIARACSGLADASC
jgi:hypothetical protein